MTVLLAVRIDGLPDLSERANKRAFKTAFEEVGSHWHANILPKHFEVESKRTYRHAPRSEGYLRRKERRHKRPRSQLVDNVWTGRMKAQMSNRAILRPFPTRVSVRMQSPQYMTMRPFNRSGPDKFAEISTFTRSDEEMLERVLLGAAAKNLQKEINNPKARRQRVG